MKYFIGIVLLLTFVSVHYKVWAYHPGDVVVLGVLDGCSACKYAEQQLDKHHIPYTIKVATVVAPELYVNGVLKGYGTSIVDGYIKEK